VTTAPITRPHERYDASLIGLHWLTAGLVISAICLIWSVHLTPRGPLHTTLLVFHRSCGVATFAATILRLALRAARPVPPAHDGVPAWQKRAATFSHWLLYALLLTMPVTGFVDSASSGHAVQVFYLFTLPLLPENRALADFSGDIHSTLEWVVYGIIALHSAAALYHHFYLGDNTLTRMLPQRPK
jgi:cytochrome b561